MRAYQTIVVLLAFTASNALAQSIVGTWVQISNNYGAKDGDTIVIRGNGSGYEVVFQGSANGGYSGTERQATMTFRMSWDRMRKEFSRAPEGVLRQAEGQWTNWVKLTAVDERTMEISRNKQNILWTGNRLDRVEPEYFIQRETYSRSGEAEGSQRVAGFELKIVDAEIYSCYRIDATKSGCVEVRNNSTRRVRLYLDQLPGVQCTADPGVSCSVPISLGSYSAKLVADDDRGIGPTATTAIQVTTRGVRLLLEGDSR